MPIYEYECQSCGHRVETIQRISDPPLTTCECGVEGQLKKLISAPAFQFKGDGWYVTDYARKDKAKGAGKENGKGADKDASQSADGGKAKGGEAKASDAASSKKADSKSAPASAA